MSLFSSSNRRIKNGGARRTTNPLEISGRSGRERSQSLWRGVKWTFKLVALGGGIAGIAIGGKWGLKRFVWENPTYALSDLRVTTDGLLTRLQIVEIAGIQEGENIFRVDLRKAKLALDGLPQVERVDVRRILPDRVDIKICERQPVAWVAASASTPVGMGTDSFLVDARGYVMRSRKILPEHLTLPVITGVMMEDVAPGQKLPSAEATAAVELIRLTAEDLRWQPRVVDVSKGYCLTVIDQRKARITFGFDAIEEQLKKLYQLIELVEPTQKEFLSVNLMLERNIPVVFAPPPSLQSPQDSKGGKGKAGISKGQSGPLVTKTGEEARSDANVVELSRKSAPMVPSLASVPAAGIVSGGVDETQAASGPGTARTVGANAASSARSLPRPEEAVRPDAIVERSERSSSRRPDPSETVSSSRARTRGGDAAASSSNRESASRTSSTKSAKSKRQRSSGTSRGGAKTASERGTVSKSGSAVRGVGPVSKGAAPGGEKPSLNPSEALRKLFSPHG
jgi:cell division protein FtsQ